MPDKHTEGNDMPTEDPETAQGSLQGATGVPPNNELDLNDILNGYGAHLTGYALADEELDLEEAKARLTTYIQAECNRVRIEECERVIRGYHSVNHLMDERELKERIAELRAAQDSK